MLRLPPSAATADALAARVRGRGPSAPRQGTGGDAQMVGGPVTGRQCAAVDVGSPALSGDTHVGPLEDLGGQTALFWGFEAFAP